MEEKNNEDSLNWEEYERLYKKRIYDALHRNNVLHLVLISMLAINIVLMVLLWIYRIEPILRNIIIGG